MHAIIYREDEVIGVFPDMPENTEIVDEYIIVENLPDVVMGIPSDERCRIKSFDPLVIEREPIPIVEARPTDEQIRIAQLEEENALMALELMNTQIRLDATEQTTADLLFNLVEKGVL